MPIVIQTKNRYSGTVSPSDLNTETTVVELGPNDDDYLVEGYIDLSQLAEGDAVTVCEYIAVDGQNYQKFICTDFSGPLGNPVIRFHTKTLLASMKYRVTITQTQGTLRSFPYGFIEEIMGSV